MQTENKVYLKIITAFMTCLIFLISNFFITVSADSNRTVKAGIFLFEGYHMKDENDTQAMTNHGMKCSIC